MKNILRNNKIKWWIVALFVLFGTIFSLNTPVHAETFAGASGTSKDLSWSITPEGHLTITGEGNYGVSYDQYPAWDEYGEYVLTAEVNVSNITRTDFMFWQCPNLKSVDLSGLDTSKVTTMTHMFYSASSLESLDLSGFDTRNVTDMSYMFSGCSSLKTLVVKGTNFSTSNVNDMSVMFSGCKALESLDISGFDVRKVTDMGHMFQSCEKLKTLDLSNFQASSVTDVGYMFRNCNSLETINLIGFKTNTVENMHHMFWGASSLKEIAFDKDFNTSNVTKMYGVFEDCISLERVDVSHFNTSKVTNMMYMFSNCRSMKSLDLKHFDTSKVTGMGDMFANCISLTTLDLSNFNTESVTGMYEMFMGCSILKTLDISSFNTGNVNSMTSLFKNCYELTEIKINTETFKTDNVKVFSYMFLGCGKLEEFDLSKFNTANATEMKGMFGGCHALKEIDLSNFVTTCIALDTPFTIGADNLEKITTAKEKRIYRLNTTAPGWVDEEGNRYANKANIEVEPNTTLYRLKNTYNINYVYDGELSNAQTTYTLDKTLALAGVVSKEHYTFDGWYKNSEFTEQITEITAGTYGDITLYAKMIPESYTITYKNVEDITNVDQLTLSYAYGVKTTPVIPTKTCFLFVDWYLDEELTQKFEGITENTFGDLTLYADWKESHELDKTNGVVIKEATTVDEGEIRYQCKNCDYTETEKIPRIITDESQINDDTILNKPNDSDVEGSDFTKFQARAVKTTKNSIRLKWNKIEGADGYKIYGNKCGKKNRFEYIKDVKGSEKTKWTHKKRKKGTYYKYIVRAYKVVDGQEITLAVSKTIHATTTGGTKGNAKSVKIKTDKKMKKSSGGYTLTLKKNKKYTIKASEVAGKKKISIHKKVKFDSSDPNVATVSKKGVVKAISPGTCYIYAYAQNGVYKKIKVVVK